MFTASKFAHHEKNTKLSITELIGGGGESATLPCELNGTNIQRLTNPRITKQVYSELPLVKKITMKGTEHVKC